MLRALSRSCVSLLNQMAIEGVTFNLETAVESAAVSRFNYTQPTRIMTDLPSERSPEKVLFNLAFR